MSAAYLQKLKASAKRKDKMRAMRKAGKTHAEIAKAMKVTPQRVQQVLAEKK